MSILNRFRKKGDPLAHGAAATDISPIGDSAQSNDRRRKHQFLILATVGVAALAIGSYVIFGNDPKPANLLDSNGKPVSVSTGDMVGANQSKEEWISKSETQMGSMQNELKGVEGKSTQIDAMQKQIDDLKGQKQEMATGGTRVLGAYQAENERLKAQLAARNDEPEPPRGPNGLYGAGSPPIYTAPQNPGMASGAGTGAINFGHNDVKIVSFTQSGDASGSHGRAAEKSALIVADSPDYLPPNSYATAKVIVGVDASAGVQSQTDPLPVVLRITGPARSVIDNGRLLTTNITGCLVNGAARADLSAEKVYVKLQKMTCAQPGGGYAVSEVKGFIAFGGKSGVRGHVVSREGNLLGKAFLASLLGGIGRGFSANSQSLLSGTNISTNGSRPTLSIGDLAQGGLGQGVSGAADTVSKYLIERAEQYQPVVEMPTGLSVEIVFLDGAFVRN